MTNEELARLKRIAAEGSDAEYDQTFWNDRKAVQALIAEVERLRAAVEPTERLLPDGWFRIGADRKEYPIQRFVLKPGENEQEAVQACFPGQTVFFRAGPAART